MHSDLRVQQFSRFLHQLSRLYIGLVANNKGLAESLLPGCRSEVVFGLLGNDELLDKDIVNFDASRRTSNHPFLGLDRNLKPLLQNLVQIVDSYHLPDT